MISSKSNKFNNLKNYSNVKSKKSNYERTKPKSVFGSTNAPVIGLLNGSTTDCYVAQVLENDSVHRRSSYSSDAQCGLSASTTTFSNEKPCASRYDKVLKSSHQQPPAVPPHQNLMSNKTVKVSVDYNPILQPKVQVPSPLMHISNKSNGSFKINKTGSSNCQFTYEHEKKMPVLQLKKSMKSRNAPSNFDPNDNLKSQHEITSGFSNVQTTSDLLNHINLRKNKNEKKGKIINRPQSCHSELGNHINNIDHSIKASIKSAYLESSVPSLDALQNSCLLSDKHNNLINSNDILKVNSMECISNLSSEMSTSTGLKEKRESHGLERLRSLRQRISTSFSRLSLSKDDAIPENEMSINNAVGGVVAANEAGHEFNEIHSQESQRRRGGGLFKSLRNRSSMMIKRHTTPLNHHHVDGGCFNANEVDSQMLLLSMNPPPPAMKAMSVSMHAGALPHQEQLRTEETTNCSKEALARVVNHRPHSICWDSSAGPGGSSRSRFRANLSEQTQNGPNFGRSDSYQRLEMLGEGSYAAVFKGYSHLIGRTVALKEIRLQHDEGAPFTAIREASLLKGLKHANIVTLHDIVHTPDSLTLVFEYVQSDLARHLERHSGGLRAHNVKLFLYQLLRGLNYCHARRILHRDLKPQNLLINADSGELKLADFGLARAKSVPSHTYSHEVVTLWYRPPDVLLGSTEYGTSLDLWGVGCIFTEMLTGTATFPGTIDADDQLDRIFRIMGCPNETRWPGVQKLPGFSPERWARFTIHQLHRAVPRLLTIPHAEDLANNFLQLKPQDRITATCSMRHSFFEDLPLDALAQLPVTSSVFEISGLKMEPESPIYAQTFSHCIRN